MRIAIASDHGGVQMKAELVELLEQLGYQYEDFGTNSCDSVDYPDYAEVVANKVANQEFDRGILICGTGIGMSIAANKVNGIRCALVGDVFSAKATRLHNDTNVLALGARVIGIELAKMIMETWLTTDFEGDRHVARLAKITQIEEKIVKGNLKMSKLHVFNHPLISHKLTNIRKTTTATKDFRETVNEIAGLMAYEITRDLKLQDVTIETPVATTTQKELAQEVFIIPILRAGLGMVDGINRLIPTAKIGHIGIYRDEETLEPKEYFSKLPQGLETAMNLVVDPMLATGGSAIAAITMLKARGAQTIKLVCLVGAPEGVEAVHAAHPDVDVYLASLDEKLNDKGYIVPGLGDAGDRLFGTK